MSTQTRGADRLIVGGSPRADLLPPEFAAEARIRSQRRGLVGLAVLAVVVVALAYGFLTFHAGFAIQLLDAAHNETTSLLDQQKDYAEVDIINNQISTIDTATLIGTSTRFDWADYLVRVQASLPAGTVINEVDALTAYPGTGPDVPGAALDFPAIGGIVFTATTTTLPNVSSWIENLSLLPGFTGATAGSITRCDCGTYKVTVELYLNEDALDDRLSLHDNDEAEEPAPAPSDTPTPTPTATSARAVVTR